MSSEGDACFRCTLPDCDEDHRNCQIRVERRAMRKRLAESGGDARSLDRSEYQRQYRLRNAEHIAELKREWYQRKKAEKRLKNILHH